MHDVIIAPFCDSCCTGANCARKSSPYCTTPSCSALVIQLDWNSLLSCHASYLLLNMKNGVLIESCWGRRKGAGVVAVNPHAWTRGSGTGAVGRGGLSLAGVTEPGQP